MTRHSRNCSPLPNEELERPIALDLARKPLDADLSWFVSQILSPPRRRSARQGLLDFLEERTNYRTIRFEYQFLLKLFGVTGKAWARKTDVHPNASDPLTPSNDRQARDLATPYDELLRDINLIDGLANYYARLYRSSTASESILTIAAALVSAAAIILYPSVAGISILVQMAVNGLVIFDSKARATQRWQERWFDYRIMAERLRCLRFLHPLGLGLAQVAAPSRRKHEILGRLVSSPVREGSRAAARHNPGKRRRTLRKATCRHGNSRAVAISSCHLPTAGVAGSAASCRCKIFSWAPPLR